jgi:uncharacterized protein YukE
MATQISINTTEAASIYRKAMDLKVSIAGELLDLDGEIMALPERGEWKGDAADKFMSVYSGMQTKIKTDFPKLLEDLAECLNKNLANLIEADAAGSGSGS